MAGFVDKVVGLYHFVSDRAPKSSPLVDLKPRTVNPWCRSDKHSLVEDGASTLASIVLYWYQWYYGQYGR